MSRSAVLLALLLLALPAPLAAGPAEVLRVCADPENLPFSSRDPAEPGFYLELAATLAERLGLRVEPVWWRSDLGRRAIRQTLLAGRCDVTFGLPAGPAFMRGLAVGAPFLRVGYALVAPAALGVSGLEDLRGRRVAVAFGSPPQAILAEREGFRTVTFRSADEAMAALGRGEVDGAFVWGPTAGYHARRRPGGTVRVVPVAGPGLDWQAGIGVRAGREALLERLGRELAALGPRVRLLAESYGFPLADPVPVGPAPAGRGSAPTEGAVHGAGRVLGRAATADGPGAQGLVRGPRTPGPDPDPGATAAGRWANPPAADRGSGELVAGPGLTGLPVGRGLERPTAGPGAATGRDGGATAARPAPAKRPPARESEPAAPGGEAGAGDGGGTGARGAGGGEARAIAPGPGVIAPGAGAVSTGPGSGTPAPGSGPTAAGAGPERPPAFPEPRGAAAVGPGAGPADPGVPPGPSAPGAAVESSGAVAAGRRLFNQHCAHCHSPDAANPEPRTDLRRLRLRYGGRVDEVYYATVTRGREGAGMPAWGERLGEAAIRTIKAFLDSVQREP